MRVSNRIPGFLSPISCFIVLAKRLSFTRAAKELYISQSTLSHKIAALEDELGARLFERNKRTVSLTTAGEVFLVAAQDIVDAYERGQTHIAKMNSEITPLAIGIDYNLAGRYLQAFLVGLQKAFPAVTFQIHETPSHMMYEALDREEIVLAMPYIASNTLPNGSFMYTGIGTDSISLLMGAAHFRAGQACGDDLGVFAHERVFGVANRESSGQYNQLLIGFLGQHGLHTEADRIEYVDEFDTLVLMVSTGQGIAFVPSSALARIDASISHQVLEGSEGLLSNYLIWNQASANPLVPEVAATIVTLIKQLTL
jgi:DNA-binding transcriptional LysR family regulator